jgi:hypothetical protein
VVTGVAELFTLERYIKKAIKANTSIAVSTPASTN